MAPSLVWKYFTKSADSKSARCCKCNKQLTFCQSTTSLSNHLEKVHKIIFQKATKKKSRVQSNVETEEDIDNPSVITKSSSASDVIDETTREQGTSDTVRSSNVVSTSSDDRSKAGDVLDSPLLKCLQNASSFKKGPKATECNNALIYMIAVDNMPLQTPEKRGFRRFVQALQPLYKIPCEDTCTRKIDEKYTVLKTLVGDKLAEQRAITLTTDLWTETKTTRSFLGLTAHYLDGVIMKSVTLGARLVEDRKTADNLKENILGMCEEWKISGDRVAAIVTDHGANIVAAAQAAFGASKHYCCFAHGLNLVAQNAIGFYKGQEEADLLEEADSDDDELNVSEEAVISCDVVKVIRKLKKIVGFFRRSEVATKELNDLQKKDLGKKDTECLRLIQEVSTRWNSLYDMIHRFLGLNELVDRALAKIARERSSRTKPPNSLTFDEVEMLRDVRDVLRPLWQATMEVCAEKSVTISKIIPTVGMVITAINNVVITDPQAFNLRVKILAELDKRFGKIQSNVRLAAATMLDPRFKKIHFDHRSPAMANAMNYLGKLVQKKIDASLQLAEQSAAAEGASSSPSGHFSAEQNGQDSLWKGHHQLVAAQRIFCDQESFGGSPLELRQYLNRPVCELNRNPLQEWQTLKKHHPHVFEVAEELLPILATSVPAERLFSKAGQLLTKSRNRLTGEHVEKLLFLQSVDEELWFVN